MASPMQLPVAPAGSTELPPISMTDNNDEMIKSLSLDDSSAPESAPVIQPSCLREPHTFPVLVLIGAPGSGKTTFARALKSLERKDAKLSILFYSSGEFLRSTGWTPETHVSTPEAVAKLESATREALLSVLHTYISSAPSSSSPNPKRLLILECVKEAAHALNLLAVLSSFGLTAVTVVHLQNHKQDINALDARALKWKLHQKHIIGLFATAPFARGFTLTTRSHELFNASEAPVADVMNSINKDGYLSFLHATDYAPKGILITPLHYPESPHGILASHTRCNSLASEITTLLSTHELKPAAPSSYLSTSLDLYLVTRGAPYLVTTKCDGLRALLYVNDAGQAFAYTLDGHFYQSVFTTDTPPLPHRSILDVELIPASSAPLVLPLGSLALKEGFSNAYALVFDVLALDGKRVWHLPLRSRLSALARQWPCEELRPTPQLLAFKAPTTAPSPSLLLKPLIKPYVAVASAATELKTNLLACTAFPLDGLIFAPDSAYMFGMDPLTFKWKAKKDFTVDVCGFTVWENARTRGKVKMQWVSMTEISNSPLTPRVFACKLNARGYWYPVRERYDRLYPNPPDLLSTLKAIALRPDYWATIDELLTVIEKAMHMPISRAVPDAPPHPLSAFNSADRSRLLLEAIRLGDLTCARHRGLCIYNHKPHVVVGSFASLCRGLVTAEATGEIVVWPFARFEASMEMKNILGETTKAPPREAVNLSLNRLADPSTPVEISNKIDGTHGILFLWEGRLEVCTRRRFDSEQAIWARAWCERQQIAQRMQPNFSYLCEIVFNDNRLVVPYAYEGIYLLAVHDPAGRLVSRAELQQIAEQLALPLPFSCTGPAKHILPLTELPLCASTAYASMTEGWVARFSSGVRSKFIHSEYEALKNKMHRVSPNGVWLEMWRGLDTEYSAAQEAMGHPLANILSALREHLQTRHDQLPHHAKQEVKRIVHAYECGMYAKWTEAAKVLTGVYARDDKNLVCARAALLLCAPSIIHPYRIPPPYEPSRNSRNTICKGWALRPPELLGIVPLQPFPSRQIPSDIIKLIAQQLSLSTLVDLRLTSVAWCAFVDIHCRAFIVSHWAYALGIANALNKIQLTARRRRAGRQPLAAHQRRHSDDWYSPPPSPYQ